MNFDFNLFSSNKENSLKRLNVGTSFLSTSLYLQDIELDDKQKENIIAYKEINV